MQSDRIMQDTQYDADLFAPFHNPQSTHHQVLGARGRSLGRAVGVFNNPALFFDSYVLLRSYVIVLCSHTFVRGRGLSQPLVLSPLTKHA